MCPSPKNFPWVVEEPLQVATTSLEALPGQLTRDREGKECYLQRHESSLQCLLSSDISLLLPEAASTFAIHFKAIVRNAECIPTTQLPHSNTYNHPLAVLVKESENFYSSN